MSSYKGIILDFLKRCWNSSTLTTWLSYFTKTGSLLFVLPLILYQFSVDEVALWYLFAIIISFGAIADFGFRSTFIRIISFISGGAQKIEVYKVGAKTSDNASVNWELFENVVSHMRKIYIFVGVGFSTLLITIGTFAVSTPLNRVADTGEAWLAWSLICFVAVIEFYGKVYKNYLEGLFKVALVKRVETLFRVGSIITSILVMIFIPSLLNLVIANRLWSVINVLRDRYLARMVEDGRFKEFKLLPFDKGLFLDIWRPAWRSGLSGLMSNGLTQLTGLLYAQIGTSMSLASYLLALKIITEIRNFSNAPLYSKIPVLGKLRATGDIKKLIAVSRKNMNLAYVIFFIGVSLTGFFSNYLLGVINSSTDFVSLDLWWLLCIAFLLHRIGGFHMQLYVSTNHIISHWVDGTAGLLFLIITYFLLDSQGVYAFPIAMIISYSLIHVPISLIYSAKSTQLAVKMFFKNYIFVPLVAVSLLLLFYASFTIL